MSKTEQIFEVNPPKSVLEWVIERLSIRTNVGAGSGGGGTPEFTQSDIAAAAAGYRDPVGQHLLGVLLRDGRATRSLVDELDFMGWFRWKAEKRQGWIDLATHRRLCAAAAREFETNEAWDEAALCKFLQIGNAKKRHLLEHYKSLTGIIRVRRMELEQHLRMNLGNDEEQPSQ